MEIHHDKHHAGYVANLNKALAGHPDLAEKTLEELVQDIDALPESIRTAVRNNGGGHFNHSLFWHSHEAPRAAAEPKGALARCDQRSTFGDFAAFKGKFSEAAAKVFGSGWAWLVKKDGKLEVVSTPEPGHPAAARRFPAPGPRRLGARLLPEVPEPPARVHRRLVERGRLGPGGEAARGGMSSRGPGGSIPATRDRSRT